MKKKRWKNKKQKSSESSSSDSDSSNDSDYRPKRRRKKSHRKNYLIKLCARLTTKFLTTAYKSKIIKFKLDEDPLQSRIYFLTFVESPEMIFSQYKETCDVVLDYPKIGGENIKYLVKKVIKILFHANIDVHSRILIAEFPAGGMKYIEKFNHILPT